MLMGLAKTGLPGVSIPAVLLMVEAFPHDAKASVGAIMPAILLGDVFAVAWFHRHADWPRLWGLVPYVAAGMAVGRGVLARTTGNELRPILGWLVAAFLIVEVGRQCFRWEKMPGQWWFAAAMGLVAGFGTMVGNAAGPVMTIYLISRGLRKQEFIGTCAWFFFIVNLSKLPIMSGLGMLTGDTLGFGLIVACMVPRGGRPGDLAAADHPATAVRRAGPFSGRPGRGTVDRGVGCVPCSRWRPSLTRSVSEDCNLLPRGYSRLVLIPTDATTGPAPVERCLATINVRSATVFARSVTPPGVFCCHSGQTSPHRHRAGGGVCSLSFNWARGQYNDCDTNPFFPSTKNYVKSHSSLPTRNHFRA